MRTRTCLAFLPLAALLVSCDRGPSGPGPAQARRLVALTDTALEGSQGDTVAVRARVEDAGGRGLPGLRVRFVPSSGSAALPESAVSDSSGIVAAVWVLGADGPNSLGVTVPGSSAPLLVFRAQVVSVGTLVVALRRIGNAVDADSFLVKVVDYTTRRAQVGDTLVFDGVPPRAYTVILGEVAPNCHVEPGASSATVAARRRVVLDLPVECYGGIAYSVGWDTLTSKLYYLGEDGVTRLISSAPGENFIQAWSPDGSRILFGRRYNDNWDIYTIRPDGTDLTLIAADPYQDLTPVWAPDGGRIAFHRREHWGGWTVRGWVVLAAATGGREQVPLDTLSDDFDPSWSPDGSTLLFSCTRFSGGLISLCAARPDGTGLRLVYAGSNAQNGQWSPDGSRIAFRAFWPQAVMVANADGSGATSLMPGSEAYSFRWAPDGKKLMVGTWEGGEVYRVHVTDLAGTRLATLPLDEKTGWFDWSGDGAKLLAVATAARELYVLNPDGSGAHPLTAGGGVIRALWRPGVRPGVGATSTSARLRAGARIRWAAPAPTPPPPSAQRPCAIVALRARPPVGAPACPR